jgi:amidase
MPSLEQVDHAIAFGSASELGTLIEARKISARELLEICISRVERLNPIYNAVVALDVDGARERAREADDLTARGESLGPLHGLPMTIKDAFEVTGMPATCGFEELRDYRPDHDAASVSRLRQAGAIIFGKTNLPTGATDHQSYNSLFGVTKNPWNLDRTPGGSSGGSAAALAAGMTVLELGSDIGGSIRVPAHFCGVYGHKPSYGIVSSQGHIPPPPGHLLQVDLGVIGPLARSAHDLELVLDLLCGPDDRDGKAVSIDLPAPRHTDLRDYRVALWSDSNTFPLDDACRQAIEAYADDLRGLGVSVDDTARPEVDPRRVYEVYLDTLFGIVGAGVPESTLRSFAEAAEAAPAGRYEPALALAVKQSLRHWMSIAEERAQICRRWAEFFRNYDLLICPITPTVAFPHDTSGTDITAQFSRTITVNGGPCDYLDNLAWPGLITVANLPATAVPTRRFIDGLPIGVQVVGPDLEDKTPLRFAQLVESELGGFIPPPGISPRQRSA